MMNGSSTLDVRSAEGHAAHSMQGTDERWVLIQVNTFKNWINDQLRQVSRRGKEMGGSHTHTHTHTHPPSHTHTPTHTLTYTHTNTQTPLHKYAHTNTHTHTNTHKHTHTH